MEMNMNAIGPAQEAKRQNESRLLRMNNVVAVGVGYKTTGGVPTDEIAVVVSVVRKLPLVQVPERARVPQTIGGVQTDVVETGLIFAQQDPREKMRPARPGISIGHPRITAGTFGCLVQRDGELFILGNNHVLANSNNAQVGDPILQPGPHDGGTLADQIGTLEQFIPVGFGLSLGCGCSPFALLRRLLGIARPHVNEPGSNTVDCAIARPLSADLVDPDILGIGIPTGVGTVTLGTPVQKSGRTTGLTSDQITQLDVTVSVTYGTQVAVFRNQLMAGAMSQGGDSGSAVLDMDRKVVGLLFAGSTSTTIMNPIQLVLDALQVQVVTA